MSFNPEKYICFDVETNGILPEYSLQPWRVPAGDAWLTSIAYKHGDKERVIGKPTVEDIRKILNYALDNNLTLLCWNSTFDCSWLIAHGFDEEIHKLKHADGMLLHRILTNEPGHEISHGLKAVVKEYFPDEAGYEEDIEFFTTDEEKLQQLYAYNLKDVQLTLRATEKIYNQLDAKQLNVARIEAEAIPLIAYANFAGLKVDVDAAQELKTKLEQRALELLQELAPHGVTEKIVRSPAQLNNLLFETWGLPKTKGESTDKEALHELAHVDERAKQLRELRETLNLKTKFVEALIASAEYNGDGTTHPQANLSSTYTARLTYSSTQGRGKDQRQTGFALHQVPRKKEFRALIKAPEGFTLVEYDASGQEYRLQALLSGDANMQAQCQVGKDPHQYMADSIAPGTPRQMGKLANLSMAYRTSAPKLKSVARVQYNIPMEIDEAKKIHAAYQQAYPGMVRYWDNQIRKGKSKGFVTTIAGRRLHLTGDWDNHGWALGSACINYPVQATASDQKLLALATIKSYLREIGGRFLFDLHDAAFLAIPNDQVPHALEQIKLLLDNLPYQEAWGFTPTIPLPWDCKAGKSWGAMEEIKFPADPQKSAGAGPDQETSPNLTALPAIVGGVTSERDLERSTSIDRPAAVITQVNFQPPNEQACELALEYARNGVKVFPCQSDKTPVYGFMDFEGQATINEDTIRRWFLSDYKSSARMVGLPCGVNNLVVIDPDVPKPEKQKYNDGVVAFSNLARDLNLDFSDVPTVISPSGGRHYIFMQPQGSHIGCKKGMLPDNVDVKGHGGYVIAAGSIRHDGPYAYAENSPNLIDAITEGHMPELPTALVDIIGRRSASDRNAEAELLPKAILLEALLETNIPNDEYFNSRDRWVEMAHAIFGASQGEPWARRAWLAWSAQREQKPGEPERVWDSIKPNAVRAGAGLIRKQLEDRGRGDLLQRAKTAQAQAVFERIMSDDPDASTVRLKDKLFSFEPFEDINIHKIQPRQFIYKKHYIRSFVSGTFAPGGVGKSTLTMVEAVAMAIGKPLLGYQVKNPLKVYVWNGEDPKEELNRRIAAIILKYELTDDDRRLMRENLFIGSGRDQSITIAVQEKGGLKIATPLVAAITTEIRTLNIDAVILDPFVSTHMVEENANGLIDAVAKTWANIANKTNCAIELVHHVRKTNGAEVTLDDARGAGSLTNAMRSTRLLNPMSVDEAAKCDIDNRWLYVREGGGNTGAKANLAPRSEQATWFKLEGICLQNATEDDEADNVATMVQWEWPEIQDRFDADTVAQVQREIKRAEPPENSQANDWGGYIIADVLGLPSETKAEKHTIKCLINEWVKEKILMIKTRHNVEKGRQQKYITAP